jgi:SAM-dependent methyltransferase
MDEPAFQTYGEPLAEVYDQWFTAHDPATVEVLAELARGGRVLEMGIGTGLVALPLAAKGVEVHGIDNSEPMVAKLRAKPGGEAIPVTMGSFAEVVIPGEFSLVFVLFNTLFALLTQDEQVRCFQNAARHLSADGVFVVEVFVPEVGSWRGGQDVRALTVTGDRIGLKVSKHDPLEQKIRSQHVVVRNGEIRMYPVEVRYAWPAELDLMAEIAGLRLRHRFGNWARESFQATSEKHVSVYERRP